MTWYTVLWYNKGIQKAQKRSVSGCRGRVELCTNKEKNLHKLPWNAATSAAYAESLGLLVVLGTNGWNVTKPAYH